MDIKYENYPKNQKEVKNPFPEHLKKEYIKCLPLIFFDKSIHVINTEEESFKAVQQLQKFKVLGFDTEKNLHSIKVNTITQLLFNFPLSQMLIYFV